MINAVLFDFDGVVVQSERLHMKTFIELLEPYDVEVDINRWYSEFAGTGSRHIFSVLLNEKGIKEDVTDFVERRKRLYAKHVKDGKLESTVGINAFLDVLDQRGMKKAIVSGGHRDNIKTALEMTGLEGRFNLIVSSEDISQRKPDPESYLKAVEMLQEEPSFCLGIEDSVAGAESVRKAGMMLIVVDSPASRRIKDYKALIDDFRDFPMELIE